MSKKIRINQNKCSACGDCQDACPQKILIIRKTTLEEKQNMSFFQRLDCFYHKNNRLAIIAPNKCSGCGLCIKACRHKAISLEKINQAAACSQLTVGFQFIK